jgi:endoglucanase
LAFAALHLALATNSSDMFKQGVGFYNQFGLASQNQVFNWDSKSPGVYVLLAQLATAYSNFSSNLTGWQNEAERYFDQIVNKQGKTPSMTTSIDGTSIGLTCNLRRFALVRRRLERRIA